MTNLIVTKFTIGTEQGTNTIIRIGSQAAREKFQGKVNDSQLEAFIGENFNEKVLHTEMNSMSNQYLVVYADGVAAGYARVTSKGHRPGIFDKKTAIRIADFRVLDKFNEIQIKRNLLEKCISICSLQQVIWISECQKNEDLELFESYGFVKNSEITEPHELGLEPVYLVKEKTIN